MSVLVECTCELEGTLFSPALLEQVTGLTFAQHQEPHLPDDARPSPGTACVKVPELIPSEERLIWLAKRITPHLQLIRDAGVERMELHVTLSHDEESCRWELSRMEVQALAELGLEIRIQIRADAAKVRGYWDQNYSE